MVSLSCGINAKAVIFDFDGVIVDTEPLHYKAFQLVLEPLGLGFLWPEYIDKYIGFDDRDAFSAAFLSRKKVINEIELHRLVQQKALVFQDVIKDGVMAYPGVVELVKDLYSKHIPIAISSGALKSDIEPILKQLGLSDYFKVIVTADDVAKSKPDPESYRLAFTKLKSYFAKMEFKQSETLAVEDTPAGITAAKGAGLQTLGVTNSYPPEHLIMADTVTNTLKNLIRA